MTTTVKIPTQLRDSTSGEAEVRVGGETVGEVLESVFGEHPELRDRLFEGGQPRRFVNLYLGGEDVRFEKGLETAVEDGSELTILPAVAGG